MFNIQYRDEQADEGRDGRIFLVRPNYLARPGTGKSHFVCTADHEQDWQPFIRLIHTRLQVVIIHRYIDTYIEVLVVPPLRK